jgi:hypothetical protein
MTKTLVLYTTYDKQETNFKKFIRDGLFEDANIKFVIIFNGICNDNVRKLVPSYVLFVERPNTGFDFGGWSYAILNEHIVNYNHYDNFIFLNSSVYGPCLPKYINKEIWPSFFTNKLTDKIKLVGCTINYSGAFVNQQIKLRKYNIAYDINDLHIQSYCWCVDKLFLEILLKENYFNYTNTSTEKWFYIAHYEVQNVRILKKYGFDYYSFQYFNQKVTQYDMSVNGFFKRVFGTEMNPYEYMFIKPARNGDNTLLKYIMTQDNI